jgi:hypothetical protein
MIIIFIEKKRIAPVKLFRKIIQAKARKNNLDA